MNFETVIKAAESDFVSLLGVRESQAFEAKQIWPDLTIAASRWEFVKDVAAMANGGGGVIVFGLSTRKLPAEHTDEIEAVHAIDLATVNTRAAESMLDEHLAPNLRDVRIVVVPGRKLAPKGLVVIQVQPQASKVILCKTMEGSEMLKEYLLGYAERDRAGTKNWSREEVVNMMRTGTTPISKRLETIEAIVTSLHQDRTVNVPSAAVDEALLKSRIDEVMSDG